MSHFNIEYSITIAYNLNMYRRAVIAMIVGWVGFIVLAAYCMVQYLNDALTYPMLITILVLAVAGSWGIWYYYKVDKVRDYIKHAYTLVDGLLADESVRDIELDSTRVARLSRLKYGSEVLIRNEKRTCSRYVIQPSCIAGTASGYFPDGQLSELSRLFERLDEIRFHEQTLKD